MTKYLLLIFIIGSASSCSFMSSAKRTPQSLTETNLQTNEREMQAPDAESNFGSLVQASENEMNSVLAEKVCRQPRETIADDYYERFCKRLNVCSLSGTSCVNHGDCCSQMCSKGFCLANEANKVPLNGRCLFASDCESNVCERAPSGDHKICYGSSHSNTCAIFHDPCRENSNCCSGKCHLARCIGSPQLPALRGQACYANHFECASGICNLQTNLCQ